MPPKGESFDFVVEQVARTTCQSCTRRSRCWVRGYATAMDGLQHLKPVLESKGRVEVQDLPGQLSVCIHPADLCTAANHGYRLWRSRRQTRARASMLRTALTEQYSALAGALAQLAAKLGQAGLPDPRREAKLAQLFAELGLDALECSVTADLAGRLTASVTICRTHFTQEEISGLVEEVSRLCRRDMDLPEITHCRTVTMLTFGEKPLFTAEFGAAGHAAAGQSVSGDALDQFCDTSGRAQMLLCDGMGTGRAAAVDGQMAAKLTAQLLRAGFAAESAARLANVALGLKGAEQEAGATLDLLTVDLYTGRAGLFKAGAAPSFLVRGGVPRMLDGASLPMGMLDSLVGRSTTFALDAGDWVVLVSDGALADGADWLMQQLQLCARLGHTPKQAAETVADAAARRAGSTREASTGGGRGGGGGSAGEYSAAQQLLLLGGLGAEGGVLMVAAYENLAGLFGHAAAVVLGDRIESTRYIVVAKQMLDQMLCHGGQAVCVINVLVVVVAVEELDLIAARIEENAGFVQQNLLDDALLQAGGAALGGALGGQRPLVHRHALGVELLGTALADFQQDVPHHTAFQQRADALPGAGLFGFVLDGGNQAHEGRLLANSDIIGYG